MEGVTASMGGDGAQDRWISCRIIDISCDGCGLLVPLVLTAGMAVRIMLPGFRARPARVAEVRDGIAHCIFATPLPTAIVDYIVRMSDPAARG